MSLFTVQTVQKYKEAVGDALKEIIIEVVWWMWHIIIVSIYDVFSL